MQILACNRKAKASQTARGSTRMHPIPNLTLHRHCRQIHLLDRSVASSAKGCDFADTGVCPTHTYTLLVSQDAPLGSHLERGGNSIYVYSVGGRRQEGRVGALSLKLIPSMQPCGTHIRGQDRKTSECTVAGGCGAPDCLRLGGGGDLFVSIGVSTCMSVCVHAFTEC